MADLIFFRMLSDEQRQYLQGLLRAARQLPPQHWVPWSCGANVLGYMSPERARWLVNWLPACEWTASAVAWHAGGWSVQDRSAVLQDLLERGRKEGVVTGWRNEKFSLRLAAERGQPANTAGGALNERGQPAFLEVERAGFRFLGMRSEAVHINGFTPDGQLWCGRRSLHKPTDPGMLDNLAAGGLPSGETVLGCAIRELAEEAGFTAPANSLPHWQGSVHTARPEPQGWHDEVLHVFNLTVPAGFVPANQDGEVAEFNCFGARQALHKLQAGEFTPDAAIALALGSGCVC